MVTARRADATRCAGARARHEQHHAHLRERAFSAPRTANLAFEPTDHAVRRLVRRSGGKSRASDRVSVDWRTSAEVSVFIDGASICSRMRFAAGAGRRRDVPGDTIRALKLHRNDRRVEIWRPSPPRPRRAPTARITAMKHSMSFFYNSMANGPDVIAAAGPELEGPAAVAGRTVTDTGSSRRTSNSWGEPRPVTTSPLRLRIEPSGPTAPALLGLRSRSIPGYCSLR